MFFSSRSCAAPLRRSVYTGPVNFFTSSSNSGSRTNISTIHTSRSVYFSYRWHATLWPAAGALRPTETLQQSQKQKQHKQQQHTVLSSDTRENELDGVRIGNGRDMENKMPPVNVRREKEDAARIPLQIDAPFTRIPGEDAIISTTATAAAARSTSRMGHPNDVNEMDSECVAIYCCASCSTPLFSSEDFFTATSSRVGCHSSGWPTFTQSLSNASHGSRKDVLRLATVSQRQVITATATEQQRDTRIAADVSSSAEKERGASTIRHESLKKRTALDLQRERLDRLRQKRANHNHGSSSSSRRGGTSHGSVGPSSLLKEGERGRQGGPVMMPVTIGSRDLPVEGNTNLKRLVGKAAHLRDENVRAMVTYLEGDCAACGHPVCRVLTERVKIIPRKTDMDVDDFDPFEEMTPKSAAATVLKFVVNPTAVYAKRAN